MEEVKVTATYAEFKETLDKEIIAAENGFVKIGYLLKIARDTNILHESGYKSMAEFAMAEYHLDDSATSRFIAINDRYSENGYSDQLQERYRGYGVSKLSEMLTLPEQIIEAIPPETTRAEIRSIKKEVAEESKITDLEVMMEPQQEETSLLKMAIKQYFHDNREQFVKVSSVIGKKEYENFVSRMMEVLAPSGMAVLMPRVSGVGKLMVTIKGKSQNWIVQNIRTMEKEDRSWIDVLYAVNEIYAGISMDDPKAVWEQVYGEKYEQEDQHEEPEKPVRDSGGAEKAEDGSEGSEPVQKTEPEQSEKKPEIAPAQKDPEKPKCEKCSDCRFNHPESPARKTAFEAVCQECKAGEKFQKYVEPEPQKPEEPEKEEQLEEDQIPGQDTVMNHPELLPAGMEAQTTTTIDGEETNATVDPTREQRKDECLSLVSMIQGNIGIENYEAALKQARKLVEQLEALI